METTGDRIRQLRNSKRMSGETLSKMVGVSQSYLSRIEQNKREASQNVLTAIAKALDTSASYLLGETDNPVLSTQEQKGPAPVEAGDETQKARLVELMKEVEKAQQIDPLSIAINCRALVNSADELLPDDRKWLIMTLEWALRRLKGVDEDPPGEEWHEEPFD